MKHESLEDQLRQHTFHPMPREWKKDILDQARASLVSSHSSRKVPAHLLHGFGARLKQWFWPHPLAWGGLAAVWFFILALNFASQDPQSIRHHSQQAKSTTDEKQMAAAEHSTLRKEYLNASLFQTSETSETPGSRPAPPPADRPRSQLVSGFQTA